MESCKLDLHESDRPPPDDWHHESHEQGDSQRKETSFQNPLYEFTILDPRTLNLTTEDPYGESSRQSLPSSPRYDDEPPSYNTATRDTRPPTPPAYMWRSLRAPPAVLPRSPHHSVCCFGGSGHAGQCCRCFRTHPLALFVGITVVLVVIVVPVVVVVLCV